MCVSTRTRAPRPCPGSSPPCRRMYMYASWEMYDNSHPQTHMRTDKPSAGKHAPVLLEQRRCACVCVFDLCRHTKESICRDTNNPKHIREKKIRQTTDTQTCLQTSRHLSINMHVGAPIRIRLKTEARIHAGLGREVSPHGEQLLHTLHP